MTSGGLLSIVIPTHNSEDSIGRLLTSLKLPSSVRVEILVVDNFSTDRTGEISETFGARVVLGGPERSAQRNLGARLAMGETLLFLDSDMEATNGMIDECATRIKSCEALCIREVTCPSTNYWARARALERDSYYRSLVFEAARCFRRQVFEALGGYNETLTGLEDIELQGRVIEGGYRIGWVDSPILHHEEQVGFRDYLVKRKRYSETDSKFVRERAALWATQRNPILRGRILLRSLARRRLAEAFFLLPGLVVTRFSEFLIRTPW